ncbi:T9SS type A sorting domain-containing protein [Pseudopedobacter beijingensis]|uniref:T9SS type A sorting domain-containing protein n=1 Tax=Pseudopedobacter beijingensis TaxID=1207056 RepID=A0ABW4IE91_9SPHI
MKKQFLLLIFFLGLAEIASAAGINVKNWRWRNNDGNETTATWKAAENTAIEVVDLNTVLRLRMELISDPDNSEVLNFIPRICYSIGDDLNTSTIIGDESTTAFVLVSTANITDGTPTTKQLTSNYPFQPGLVVSNFNSNTHSLPVGYKSEYEFVIKPTANIVPGKKYYFTIDFKKHYNSATRPYLTVSSALPVKLASFQVQKNNEGALLIWKTESETNNDRFEVERSANGKKWAVIAKVPGKGIAASYQHQDLTPLAGTNYYRLVQYDKDGTLDYSGVRSVNFALAQAEISIYPNPTTQKLNIALPNFKGKSVELKVADLKGKLVAASTVTVTNHKITYLLPNGIAKGIYVINLTGDNLNYNQKVTVK